MKKNVTVSPVVSTPTTLAPVTKHFSVKIAGHKYELFLFDTKMSNVVSRVRAVLAGSRTFVVRNA